MKEYLSIMVHKHNGGTFSNPLKLSEVHLISKLTKENKYVEVSREKISNEGYIALFGG